MAVFTQIEKMMSQCLFMLPVCRTCSHARNLVRIGIRHHGFVAKCKCIHSDALCVNSVWSQDIDHTILVAFQSSDRLQYSNVVGLTLVPVPVSEPI